MTMTTPVLEVLFHGMEKDAELESYFEEKISKFNELFLDPTEIKCTFRQHKTRNYCTLIIMVSVPNAMIRVKERAPDFRIAIDKAIDTLGIRLKKHREKLMDHTRKKKIL